MKGPQVVALPLVLLAVAGGVSAQSQVYTGSALAPSQHVIIPWTHFGQAPPSQPADSPPQAVAANSAASQLGARVDAAGPAPNGANQGAKAPPAAYCGPGEKISLCPAESDNGELPSDTGPKLYEADISKKHPHPPEPVDLPIADQNTPILTTLPDRSEREFQLQLQLPQTPTGESAASAQLKTQDHSPDAQIAELTAGYEQREAERNARCAQLEAAGRNDPTMRALARIETIHLLLQGEADRRVTSQQLAKAFASLGQELDARAQKVRALTASRNQTAVAAEADLKQLDSLIPQRELVLRNMAMLPGGRQNDAMIRSLNSQLAQEEDTRKLDEQRSREARKELQALQAETDELQQAEAEARGKSASFADAAQSAQVNENLLADRLEYSVAQMRAADLLASASKALDHTAALNAHTDFGPLPASGAVPPFTSSTRQSVDQLRACIRKTGNPDVCRAKGDQ